MLKLCDTIINSAQELKLEAFKLNLFIELLPDIVLFLDRITLDYCGLQRIGY